MYDIKRRTNVLYCFMVLVTTKYQGSSAQDPSNSLDTEDGYRLERFNETSNSQNQAQTVCAGRGWLLDEGWLVRIKNSDTQEYVQNLISGDTNEFFIGLRYDTDGWYWNDGTRLTEENWATGQGLAQNNTNCACVQATDGNWTEVACDTARPYICQSDIIYVEALETEIPAILGQSKDLTALIATQEGTVDVKLYKLPDTSNSLMSGTAAETGWYMTYPIKDITFENQGEYIFVATPQIEPLYNRTATTKLTVQVPTNITDVEPWTIRSPVTSGPDRVVCKAYGVPAPTVKWKNVNKNQDVTVGESNEVYQTSDSSGDETVATLHVKKANQNDHGMYACEAANTLYSHDVYEDEAQISLTVLGSPSIVNLTTKCTENNSIFLVWKPNDHTSSVDHKIVVRIEEELNKPVAEIFTNPKGKKQITTIFENLAKATTYYVMITVCPDDCIENLNTSISTTITVPAAVTDSTVTQNEDECILKWEWNEINDNVSFLIRETVEYVYIPSSAEDDKNSSLVYHSGEPFQITITPKANRNYKFTITAKENNCWVESEEEIGIGKCSGDFKEPAVADTPSALSQDNGLQLIQVTIPDEERGPISCIFVIVASGENPSLTNDFSDAALQQLSAEALTGNPTKGEYLAVAIPRAQFDDTGNIIVELGNDNLTLCDPESDDYFRGAAFAALNLKLVAEKTYTYYVVTTTPYQQKDGVAFQHSKPGIFKIDANDTEIKSSLAWIAAPVLIIILIISVYIGYIYKRKRNSNRKTENSLSTEEGQKETNHAYCEIAEAGYETVNPAEVSTTDDQRNVQEEPYGYEPYEI